MTLNTGDGSRNPQMSMGICVVNRAEGAASQPRAPLGIELTHAVSQPSGGSLRLYLLAVVCVYGSRADERLAGGARRRKARERRIRE